ncbi:MAG TPA: SRPBCC family protein [Thermoleophilaceae bacterium]
MKLAQAFEVTAPVERVWATLIDVEAVAPCLPGAEVTASDENGVYHGTFQVKIGAATAAYRGTLSIDAVDEATRTVTLRANGQDKRGQGSARATIVSTLIPGEAGATHVEVETDLTITGRLASFGRPGVMQDVANRLLRDFARCLEQRIGAGASAGADP